MRWATVRCGVVCDRTDPAAQGATLAEEEPWRGARSEPGCALADTGRGRSAGSCGAGQQIVLPQIVHHPDTAILTRQHRIPSDLRS